MFKTLADIDSLLSLYCFFCLSAYLVILQSIHYRVMQANVILGLGLSFKNLLKELKNV